MNDPPRLAYHVALIFPRPLKCERSASIYMDEVHFGQLGSVKFDHRTICWPARTHGLHRPDFTTRKHGRAMIWPRLAYTASGTDN